MMNEPNRKSLRSRITSDQEVLLAQIPNIYRYARDTITDYGKFEYTLPVVFDGTCIQSLTFNVKRQYRSRTKYTYTLYIGFRRNDGDKIGVEVTLLMGTLDDLLYSIKDIRMAERYLSCINNEIEYYYYNLRML